MFEQSLFVRMQLNHPNNVHLLSIQYRMHPDISRFPSQHFYDSELQDGPDMERLRQKIWHQSNLFGPYRFFDIQGKESTSSSHSFVNHQEVTTAISLFRRLVSDFREQDFSGMIGIITPYKQQLFELKKRFQNEIGGRILETIEFNTTDAFQGREREIIIFSCVRASPNGGVGFLSDIRRMNVGLTRAKSSLFVLGNAQSLLRNEFWGKLVRDARMRGVYTDGNIQAFFSRSTRISDSSAREVILPMAMDVDAEESNTAVDEAGSRLLAVDPRVNPDVPAAPRKRPGTVDPKPNSWKQDVTKLNKMPPLSLLNQGKNNSSIEGLNRLPVFPLGRPIPTPIISPTNLLAPSLLAPKLLAPKLSVPSDEEPTTGTIGGPICHRCGNRGHVRQNCTNPGNPAKVQHMRKYETGDPHSRVIPSVQSSIVDDNQSLKRKPPGNSFQPSKRREMAGQPTSSSSMTSNPNLLPLGGSKVSWSEGSDATIPLEQPKQSHAPIAVSHAPIAVCHSLFHSSFDELLIYFAESSHDQPPSSTSTTKERD